MWLYEGNYKNDAFDIHSNEANFVLRVRTFQFVTFKANEIINGTPASLEKCNLTKLEFFKYLDHSRLIAKE